MSVKFELERGRVVDQNVGNFLFYSDSMGDYFYVVIQPEYGISAMGHTGENCIGERFYMVDIERGRIVWDLVENLNHYTLIKPKDNKIVFVEK